MLKHRLILFLCAVMVAGVSFGMKPAGQFDHVLGDGKKEAAAPTPKTNSKGDAIAFFNGDVLHGQLKGMDKKSVLWRSSASPIDIPFIPKELSNIFLNHASSPRPDFKLSEVTLTNGDELVGTIEELNEKQFLLNTWYAGLLPIERSMVESIRPNLNQSAFYYRGPIALDHWKTNRPNAKHHWKLEKGALYSPAANTAIGRDVNMPDKAQIEFDLAWRGQYNLYVYLYHSGIQSISRGAYQMTLASSYTSLHRMTSDNNSGMVGGSNYRMMNWGHKKKARVTIFVDKSKQSVSLAMDDELVQKWIDAHDWVGSGTSLGYRAQSNGQVKISNIRVSEWDGILPDEKKEEADNTQDQIELMNRDVVQGSLKAIQNGKATFFNDVSSFTIPLERIKNIRTGSTNRQRARRYKEDVIGYFYHGGKMTLRLNGLKDFHLNGYSENFGDKRVNIHAFHRLQFNVYDDRHKELNVNDLGF